MAKNLRLLVLGGNGYAGRHICEAAVLSGRFDVSSLNRTGFSSSSSLPSWSKKVEWHTGDVTDTDLSHELFPNVDIIFSTIGAFGSNAFMEKVCGDINITAVTAAAKHKVSQFGFISSAQVGTLALKSNMPMYGYFHGKTRAEEAIKESYPEAHVIVRPGFLYGSRTFEIMGRSGSLPLQYLGIPITTLCTSPPLLNIVSKIPFLGKELQSMVSVQAMAEATVASFLQPSTAKLLVATDIRTFEKDACGEKN